MENWRKYLNEGWQDERFSSIKVADIPSEKEFGINPDDLECIKKIREEGAQAFEENAPSSHVDPFADPPWLDNFKSCMEKSGYKYLGKGQYRISFEIPNRPEYIIKIANPDDPEDFTEGKEMNKEEASNLYQTTSNLVVPVYADSSRFIAPGVRRKDFLWIIMQKVHIIETWTKMQEFFPVWNEYVNKNYFTKDEFSDYCWAFFRKGAVSKEDLKTQVTKSLFDNGKPELTIEKHRSAIIKRLLDHSMFTAIRIFATKNNLPTWDIRPENVGFITKNGEEKLVIVDPGFRLFDVDEFA
jgi:hypothetical protein